MTAMTGAKAILPATIIIPLLGLACGSGDPAPVDTNIEPMVSVEGGVYGQCTAVCDIAEGCGWGSPYLEGTLIGVFAGEVEPSNDGAVSPLARAQAGQLGFFEVDLETGTYTLCPGDTMTANGPFFPQMRCTTVTLTVERPVQRHDFISTVGGGMWTEHN